MPHALQVNFRRLMPSEELVRLAKRRLDELAIDFQGTSECVVSIERRDGTSEPVVDAHVRIAWGRDPAGSSLSREAQAAHADPQEALVSALSSLEASLQEDGLADEDDGASSYSQPRSAWI